MKLKFELEFLEIDDDIVAVPVGDGAEEFHGVLKVNDSARFILEKLREETTAEAIVDAIMQEYEGERSEITDFVEEYIATLQDNNLLV